MLRTLLTKQAGRTAVHRYCRVHWLRPVVVVELTYLTWTEDNVLRQLSRGQRQDKPAR